MQKSKLILIPTPLGEADPAMVLPSLVFQYVESLNNFIVEDIRSARRFIKKIIPTKNIDSITFYLLNEHTKPEEYNGIIKPLLDGINMGLMSEAGLPALADPGAAVIRLAHSNGIKVVPISGPSSISMALIASGLNGQNFCFNGYIPVKQVDRIKYIKYLELKSVKNDESQIFIETPYRNNNLFNDLLINLKSETYLCVACNIGEVDEFIYTTTVSDWKNNIPNLHKKPCVFILQA